MNLIRELALWLACDPKTYECYVAQRVDIRLASEETTREMVRIQKLALAELKRAAHSL